MKTKEYLKNLRPGSVVNKRGLAYLKRLGFIWDYSRWGYLESLRIWGVKREGEQWRDEFHLEVSPKRKCPEAEKMEGAMHEQWRQCGTAWCDKTFDQMLDLFGPQGRIEWEGVIFRPMYFDGCFKPYLVRTAN